MFIGDNGDIGIVVAVVGLERQDLLNKDSLSESLPCVEQCHSYRPDAFFVFTIVGQTMYLSSMSRLIAAYKEQEYPEAEFSPTPNTYFLL